MTTDINRSFPSLTAVGMNFFSCDGKLRKTTENEKKSSRNVVTLNDNVIFPFLIAVRMAFSTVTD